MAEAKHTPGPWNVGGSERMHVYYLNPRIEAGEEEIIDPSHDSVVAKCDDMGAWSGIPDPDRRANARLIAAAPDLLAACKAILASDRAGFYEIVGQDDDGHPLNAAGMARKQLEAAIAKAEGR